MNTKILKSSLAALMAMSLAACGSSGTAASTASSAASSTDAASAPAETTASGKDSITVAIDGQFTTLDPALNTEVVNNYILDHIYSGLFKLDPSGKANPELCDSYEMSEDGLTYTFHLKKDAVWSDGSPITSKDYEYSYLRALSYGGDNAWTTYDMTQFLEGAADYNAKALEAGPDFDCTTEDHSGVGIETPDDYTLVLHLAMPCTYLTSLMTGGSVWSAVPQGTPQHDSTWSMSTGNLTSGPYVLTEFNENEKAVLAKSDVYWNKDTITMPNITMQVITDPDAQAAAFKSDEIDFATGVSIEVAQGYEGTDNLWIMNKPLTYFLAINSGPNGPEWAQNVNLRKALYYAIDKDALSDVIGGSTYYEPLNGYVPHGLAGIDGDFRDEADADGYELKYDPDKAKELLGEEGYDESSPLKITYKYSNNGIHEDVATVLQQMWEAVGVEVTPEAVESGVYYDQLDNSDYEIARYGLTASSSPVQFLEIWTTGMQVTPQVDDPAYDDMIADIKATTDPKEFITKCHEAEDYLVEENCYIIPLFQQLAPALVQSGLSGQEMEGTGIFFGYCHY
ncbi:MAG: peptide ABC transporter substrate-binding protein [Bulleidia sp.]|nr:peptide ABC transporter substrate-binding protein [Bulleidia sp.]